MVLIWVKASLEENERTAGVHLGGSSRDYCKQAH